MIAADLPGHIYSTYNIGVSDDHSFVKDILPILSALLVLILFIWDRVADSRNRRKELIRTWYFKAHLEPNTTKVNDFFDNVERLVDDEIPKISALAAAGGTPIIEVTAVLKSISDLKRHFSHQVLIPLESTYPQIFENSEKILRDIEDLASITLTTTGTDFDKFEKFYLALFQKKAELLKQLSQPILGKPKAENLKVLVNSISKIKKERKASKGVKTK